MTEPGDQNAAPDGPAARRAFLGLGSNLGDRERYLRDAVDRIGAAPGVQLVAVSSLYETEPVGGPEQDPFANLVVEVATHRSARDLLALAQACEAAAERVRLERWGPRTLDVDVLWVEGERYDDVDLVVPHPRMWERRFVLAPLAELAPDLVSDEQLAHARGEVSRRDPLG